jgi:hypothetical protein
MHFHVYLVFDPDISSKFHIIQCITKSFTQVKLLNEDILEQLNSQGAIQISEFCTPAIRFSEVATVESASKLYKLQSEDYIV